MTKKQYISMVNSDEATQMVANNSVVIKRFSITIFGSAEKRLTATFVEPYTGRIGRTFAICDNDYETAREQIANIVKSEMERIAERMRRDITNGYF